MHVLYNIYKVHSICVQYIVPIFSLCTDNTVAWNTPRSCAKQHICTSDSLCIFHVAE